MKYVHNSAQRLISNDYIHVTAGCILFYNNNYYLHIRRGKVPLKVITAACRFPTYSFVVMHLEMNK